MSGDIAEVTKSWLVDPAWQKVFKHTVDVIEDYTSYVLVAVATLCLSVRLLTTLGTGDLVCIIIGVEHEGNTTIADLGPYPPGGTVAMVNYANTDEPCIRAVFTIFLEYLPYIMLLQTLLLVVIEKFTFRIPRIAQRVERFYKNIVEESLFGKDPDVAEDMYDSTTSTEAISRRRQRNEICMTLKRSSIIHHVYIAKNVVEILLVSLYLPLNIHYAMQHLDKEAKCHVDIQSFPGVVDTPATVHFQCHGKKMSFYALALWIHSLLLACHGLCSIIAIFWCLYLRAVTNLLNTIESMRTGSSIQSIQKLGGTSGEDFLFLFDLLAHSCGLESTLRVLTHSDPTFYEICKPNIDPALQLELEEDKLKVIWAPADIEKWLQTGIRSSSTQKSIVIDSYEVTIFPAESCNHTHTLPAQTMLLGPDAAGEDPEIKEAKPYFTWFFDLNGGRTEYVITIACMIGKSRMKGEKVVTNLVPYGPEKPRAGMVRIASTNQVEIFWDPPKGEFTKYVLKIDRLSDKTVMKPNSFPRLNSLATKSSILDTAAVEQDQTEQTRPNVRVMENLSFKLTTYTILGLEPGEKYKIELGTKTGNVSTRQPITDVILTCPLPPRGLRVSEATSNSCLTSWLLPDGHPCLRGFQIQIKMSDGKIFKDVAVTKTTKSFHVRGLQSCQDYDISVIALCLAENNRRTESEISLVNLTTLPEQVRNLRLDHSLPNVLSVKWDTPLVAMNLRYFLTINGNTMEEDLTDEGQMDTEESVPGPQQDLKSFSSTVEVPGDKTQHTFTKLPEMTGAGHPYDITIVAVVITPRENEVFSPDVTERFMTKPLPPTNFRLGSKDQSLQICWHKSLTTSVRSYKVRWKPFASQDTDELLSGNIKTEEATVELDNLAIPEETTTIYFTFPEALVQVGVAYKVNVYAVAESVKLSAESKELHEKITVKSPTELALHVEEPTVS